MLDLRKTKLDKTLGALLFITKVLTQNTETILALKSFTICTRQTQSRYEDAFLRETNKSTFRTYPLGSNPLLAGRKKPEKRLI